MLGNSIAETRRSMSLDASGFAMLLGVHQATVYRWEKADFKEVKMEPMQRQILAALDLQIAKKSRAELVAFSREVGAALVGGGLFALYVVLREVFDGWDAGSAIRVSSERKEV